MSFVGVAFWKSPRRKIFAVSQRDLRDINKASRKSAVADLDSSDEESDFANSSLPKKQKLEKRIDEIGEDVLEIKETITEMLSLTPNTKLPMGFQRLVRDAFKCQMCHSIPNPPLIVSKCCKQLLGCESCVNNWFGGPDAMLKTCPLCREPRGRNETMLFRGFDDFVERVKVVFENNATDQPATENRSGETDTN